MPALAGLRVLDLSERVAGPFCTRMLAGFGADVVKVEPPGGESGRRLLLLTEDPAGPRHSAFFGWLNAGKRGITLDIATATGVALFRRLVAEADVVVESSPPGTPDALGLDFGALERLRPGVILVTVTPFGGSGPWRDLPGDDLAVAALSGWASINGTPDGPPLKPSGYQASFQAGIAAFDATLAAVLHREATATAGSAGEGQHVDVSLLEPSVASFAPALLRLAYEGAPMARQPSSFQRGPVPARDGYFSLTLSRAHFWRDAMTELGLPHLAGDERFYEPSYRQAHSQEIAPEVEGRIAAREKRELFEALGALRVVSGMVLDTEELHRDPHVRERGFLVEQAQSDAGVLAVPGAPFRMSATPWATARPAPRLGQHTAEVLAAVGVQADELARLWAAGVV